VEPTLGVNPDLYLPPSDGFSDGGDSRERIVAFLLSLNILVVGLQESLDQLLLGPPSSLVAHQHPKAL